MHRKAQPDAKPDKAPPNKAPPQPLTYTVESLSAATGVPRSTIYQAMTAGELRSFKIGRRRMFRVEAVRAWLDSHQQG